MCLVLFAHDVHPLYRLVFAANRDEFYERPTAPAAWWDDAPDVLAGRDLRGGGTWCGITRSGRFAAVTNFRDPAPQRSDAPSRGDLVSDFLRGTCTPAEYLDALVPRAREYNGFNLLVGLVGGELHWYSNRADRPCALRPGLYGLSNHLLDTPWPKVVRGKRSLRALVDEGTELAPEPLFEILADAEPAPDAELPDTGVGIELERLFSPPFTRSPEYGTRSSSALLVERGGGVTFAERTFQPGRDRAGDVEHRFQLSPRA